MTQNIDGHSRSLDSNQKLISKLNPDIFLRQEDLLFTFKHFMLNQVNADYIGLGKSVDCESQKLVTGNSKAKWGLDILFRKDLNSSISHPQEFSSPRVQIAKLNLDIPIILINVYLPSSSCPESEYDSELSRLSAALDAYSTEGAVILAGDFNRSLFRTNQSDRKFQKFCHTQGLTPAQCTTDIPTYHGYNNTTSRIDYVLWHSDSCSSFGLKHEDIRIVKHICKENFPHILSTHDALLFKIVLPHSVTATAQKMGRSKCRTLLGKS